MKNEEISWCAGLFEGEGTFSFHNNKAKGVSITSTDLDVLNEFKKLYNGSIYVPQKRKSHWKQSYMWVLRGDESFKFVNDILPYLKSRRTERAKQWLASRESNKKTRAACINKYKEIVDLYNTGNYTHAALANKYNLDRSTISKAIKKYSP